LGDATSLAAASRRHIRATAGSPSGGDPCGGRVLARMPARPSVGDDGPVTSRSRGFAAAGVVLYGVAVVLLAVAAAGPAPGAGDELGPALVALPPSILLGVVVTWRRPESPVGPALVWLATAPALTWAVENQDLVVSPGVWPFNLAGFVMLCLVFPDGLLPGRRPRAVPWAFLAAALLVTVVISAQEAAAGPGGRPGAGWIVADVVAGLALLAALGAAVASLVVRYRRGDDLTRLQLRWLMLGAGSVPVLLAAGWVAEAAGASVSVAYSGFLVAMLLLLPATVAVAILRHDLLDVDRLLNETVAWVLTSVVAASVFAGVVLLAAEAGAEASGADTGLAAFVAALVLLPLHRRVHAAVARVLDRERTVVTARLRAFVREVRDGDAEPEQVQDALRDALHDPGLAVLVRLPGAAGLVDLTGEPATAGGGDGRDGGVLPLDARGSDVGAIVLGTVTARRRRLAREAAVEVRLPIEVSRLRLELRQALDDARASRARLVEAVTQERRRLERDLHDGAQQRVVAVGMRLRSLQRSRSGDAGLQAELDAAVTGLEAIVAELRRLAHGVRPSRLDDGLDVAVRDLVSGSPIPVTVRVADVEVSEAVATTAYFVVAECLANTLKHAGATAAEVTITQAVRCLVVQVSDDGRGGARHGFGLTAMQDRVAALGGRLAVDSPAGAGTTVRAEI
jgi:signal transduction histidine kinase